MDLTRIHGTLQLLPLAVSLAAFVIHILLHHLITTYVTGKTSRKEADYMVWSWMSVGLTVGWVAAFWQVMPLGRISIDVLIDTDTTKRLMTAYITYHIAILPYQWISSLLFAEAPVMRLIRKTVPVALLTYGIFVDTRPSTVIMLVSWALQHGVADMIIDVQVMERVRGSASKFKQVIVAMAAFATVQLFLSSALPVFENDHAKVFKVTAVLYVVCELAFELQPVSLT